MKNRTDETTMRDEIQFQNYSEFSPWWTGRIGPIEGHLSKGHLGGGWAKQES